MTVSAILARLAGSDDKLLADLHDMLSEQVELSLANLEGVDASHAESVKAMSAHAVAAVDRIFITAKRMREQQHP